MKFHKNKIFHIEKIYKHSSLNGLRTVFRQLVCPPYSSKDAPRPPFSNALRFILFGPLLMSLRAHFWTVALEKIHKIRVYVNFFEKKFKMLSLWSSVEECPIKFVLPFVTVKRCAGTYSFWRIIIGFIWTIISIYAYTFMDILSEQNHRILVYANFFPLIISKLFDQV